MVYDWFQRQAAQPESPASQNAGSEVQPSADQSAKETASASTDPVASSAASESSSASSTAASQPQTDVVSDAPTASADEDPLEWARQAYARLKAQQAAQTEQSQPSTPSAPEAAPPTSTPASEPVPDAGATVTPAEQPAANNPAPPVGLSLLEQAAAQREERRQELDARATAAPEAPVSTPQVDAPSESSEEGDQPQLGEFDDTFTWSAEVLAAQGRRVDQAVSYTHLRAHET